VGDSEARMGTVTYAVLAFKKGEVMGRHRRLRPGRGSQLRLRYPYGRLFGEIIGTIAESARSRDWGAGTWELRGCDHFKDSWRGRYYWAGGQFE
jgi:hypothetical protein